MIQVVQSRPFGYPAPVVTAADAIRGITRIAQRRVDSRYVTGYALKKQNCAGSSSVSIADGSPCSDTNVGTLRFGQRSNGKTVDIGGSFGVGAGAAGGAASVAVESARYSGCIWVIASGSERLVYSCVVPTSCTDLSRVKYRGERDLVRAECAVNGNVITTGDDQWTDMTIPAQLTYPVTFALMVSPNWLPTAEVSATWSTLHTRENTATGLSVSMDITEFWTDEPGAAEDTATVFCQFWETADPTNSGILAVAFNMIPYCYDPTSGGARLGTWENVVGGAAPECDPDGKGYSADGVTYWMLVGSQARHYLIEDDSEIVADRYTLAVPLGATICAVMEI